MCSMCESELCGHTLCMNVSFVDTMCASELCGCTLCVKVSFACVLYV